jgi:hypothetical protein
LKDFFSFDWGYDWDQIGVQPDPNLAIH